MAHTRSGIVLLLLASLASSQESTGRVKVQIQDEKPTIFEPVAPVDAARRIDYHAQPNMGVRLMVEGKTLHLGYIYTFLKIDERVAVASRAEMAKVPLANTPGGKLRDGYQSKHSIDKIHIVQTVEVVATKSGAGQQRRRDSVLVRYSIENKDTVAHKVGLRIGMDVFCVDNDGALFAAPTHPGKVLDGIELKDKTIPDYLQVLQRPDLKNPGFVAHMTFGMGGGIEKPSKIVLTSLGAGSNDNWTLQAIPAMGDSAMSVCWDPTEIKPGGKREVGYAYGQGIAPNLENEGNLKVELAGSFEPGKTFTVATQVADPAPGQALTLLLPPGMELVEGKEIQPVPTTDAEGNSMVLWKARVLRTGQFVLRVQSSTGIIQTKLITITR